MVLSRRGELQALDIIGAVRRFFGLSLPELTSCTARRALLIVAAIQPDCFEIVLTRMLVRRFPSCGWIFAHRDVQSARFLILDRRMTESWSQLGAAVRTAQAIGLHRDGADMVSCSQSVLKLN